MSKGGGGGYDTSGMEKATQQATALQEKIYEETRADVQPWYQAGVGGIGKLSDLLGISGGSVLGRQDVYDELLPQYTTPADIQPAAGGGQWTGAGGALYGDEGLANASFLTPGGEWMGGGRVPRAQEYMPAGAAPQPTTDYTGLNAAVEARLGEQGTPEGYGSLLEQFGMEQFEEDPGAQYRREQAQTALERAMAAQGTTLGGGGYGQINPQVATALSQQQQGLASQEYGQAFDRYNIGQQNVFNRLMGVAGMGQGTTGQMQQGGQAYATNVGNLQTGLAGAQFQAQQAQAAQPSMFSQVLQTAGQVAPYVAAFSDIRLKENIKLVDVEQGHNIYEFDYKDGSGRYRGVMAHEVQKIEPDAVLEHSNGYLMVDYDKIGIEMERV